MGCADRQDSFDSDAPSSEHSGGSGASPPVEKKLSASALIDGTLIEQFAYNFVQVCNYHEV